MSIRIADGTRSWDAYHLYPSSPAVLRENLASHWSLRFTGDVGISFLDALSPEEAIPLLQQRRVALLEALAEAREDRPMPERSSYSWNTR